jgi:hypothetical protein
MIGLWDEVMWRPISMSEEESQEGYGTVREERRGWAGLTTDTMVDTDQRDVVQHPDRPRYQSYTLQRPAHPRT